MLVYMATLQLPVEQAVTLTTYVKAFIRDHQPALSVVRGWSRQDPGFFLLHIPPQSLFHPNLYNEQGNRFHPDLAPSALGGRWGR